MASHVMFFVELHIGLTLHVKLYAFTQNVQGLSTGKTDLATPMTHHKTHLLHNQYIVVGLGFIFRVVNTLPYR